MVNTFLSTHGSFLAPRVESIDVPTLPGRFYQVWRLNEELREKENTILRHHLGADSQNVKIDIVQISVANTPVALSCQGVKGSRGASVLWNNSRVRTVCSAPIKALIFNI